MFYLFFFLLDIQSFYTALLHEFRHDHTDLYEQKIYHAKQRASACIPRYADISRSFSIYSVSSSAPHTSQVPIIGVYFMLREVDW